MNYLEILTKNLSDNRNALMYDTVREIIKNQILNIDEVVSDFIPEVYERMYKISILQKEDVSGKKGFLGIPKNYGERIKDQYRKIYKIQEEIRKYRKTYNDLEGVLIALTHIQHYHMDLLDLNEFICKSDSEKELKYLTLKYLDNKEFDNYWMNQCKEKLHNEGIKNWHFDSVMDISAIESLHLRTL